MFKKLFLSASAVIVWTQAPLLYAQDKVLANTPPTEKSNEGAAQKPVESAPSNTNARDFKAGDILIKAAVGRAIIAPNGAVYMTLSNTGKIDDRLYKATSPICQTVELHDVITEGGISKMRPIEAIELKGGATAELKRGGLHIMLMGLKEGKLEKGKTFPLTLHFEKAGVVEIEVPIAEIK